VLFNLPIDSLDAFIMAAILSGLTLMAGHHRTPEYV